MSVTQYTIAPDATEEIILPANSGVILRFKENLISNDLVSTFRPDPLTGAEDFYSVDLGRTPSGNLADVSATANLPEGGTWRLENKGDAPAEICVTVLT